MTRLSSIQQKVSRRKNWRSWNCMDDMEDIIDILNLVKKLGYDIDIDWEGTYAIVDAIESI